MWTEIAKIVGDIALEYLGEDDEDVKGFLEFSGKIIERLTDPAAVARCEEAIQEIAGSKILEGVDERMHERLKE